MKIKSFILILLSISVILFGCSTDKENEIGGTNMDSDQNIVTPEPTKPEENEIEDTEKIEPDPLVEISNDQTKQDLKVDVFAKLYPDRDTGSIPKGYEYNELAMELTSNIRGRLTEITYTFLGTKISMETLVGNREISKVSKSQDEDMLELVYDQSEYYNYVLYLPDSYDPTNKEVKWPVIYFLHGIGERGNDLSELLNYGVPKYIKENGGLEAIMIAPQCPAESHWADTNDEEPRLEAFIWENAEKFNIDTDRMYLTGLSMGGRGTWKQALAMPDIFAAIAVVCGRTNSYDFSEILDLPVWIFHGALDSTVAFENVNSIVAKLYQQEHEYFKLTVYPFLSHDTWTPAYARPDLYEWLLSYNLKDRME
ncbi:MAG: hypothetical protein EWM47_01210 [Anaerolineaceae bacterium]|nr:MAG: hypothetical protein EWM47_01210 [Anaerolineaceae bacterium]